MKEMQFSIRSLLVATFLICLSLPFGITHYQDFVNFLFPSKVPLATSKPATSFTLPLNLMKARVWGVVLRKKRNLVAVSFGLEDGVQEGQTVSLYRDKQQIDTGFIVKIKDNLSACRFQNSDDVETGDEVRVILK